MIQTVLSAVVLYFVLTTASASPLEAKSVENSTSDIRSEKYNVSLTCVPGEIVLDFQFAEAFRGVIYADRDPKSPCKVRGDGSKKYVLRIPLQTCGTVENPERTFTNNINLRYHPVLEIDGDETKTIECKYGKVRFVFGNASVNESK